MIKNILVTGDRGYIGAVLVPLLIKNNFNITGVDTEFYKTSLGEIANYKRITKDIRRIKKADLRSFDAIIHLAALSNDPLGDLNPRLTEEINYEATLKLARLGKKAGVKRFIFSSSCSVYGETKEKEVNENSKAKPITIYAKTKVLSENKLIRLRNNDFCIAIMRNATVYGFSPKFRDDLVVNDFVVNGLFASKIIVKSDGTPWRPLIDIRDLSRAFIEFLKVDKDFINGEIINVGFNENNFQVKNILEKVKGEIPGCVVEYNRENIKDLRSYIVNFDKFSGIFPNFTQEWPFEKSIRDMIDNLKKTYKKSDLKLRLFTRVKSLKRLQEEGYLDNKLFWNKV